MGYEFDVYATDPDGPVSRVFLKYGVALPAEILDVGIVPREVVEFPAGASYRIAYPVDAFEVRTSRTEPGTVELATVLAMGYLIHIKYDMPPSIVRAIRTQYPDLWTGMIESGKCGGCSHPGPVLRKAPALVE